MVNMNQIDEEDLRYKEQISIGGYDVGPDRTITLARLIEALHEASTRQVMRLGLSAIELEPFDVTWVLVRQHLTIYKLPVMGDVVRVETYPTGKDRLFTYRDFKLTSASGDLLVTCASSWILMNTRTRKIGQYPPAVEALLESTNGFDHLPRSPKLSFMLSDQQTSIRRLVYRNDLDFNRHLSTPHYYRWMMDDFYRQHPEFDQSLSTFSLLVKGEAREADVITIGHHFSVKDEVHHIMQNEKGPIALAKSVWT
ncbi:MAG: hypothetical protein KTR24_01550 [Saprospiraceae bacterium]|nr:hypothetical protein [Saprospiraceae bacterium]